MLINRVDFEAFQSTRLARNQRRIGMPEDARNRLNVSVGDRLRINGRLYQVTRAFLEEVTTAENLGVGQDSMVFFRVAPNGERLRSLNRRTSGRVPTNPSRPTPPPSAVSSPRRPAASPTPGRNAVRTPAVNAAATDGSESDTHREPIAPDSAPTMAEATVETARPQLTINGLPMVPCAGNSMDESDRTGLVVRLSAAARHALGVRRNDGLTINGHHFVVRSAHRSDMELYPDVVQSEMAFFHPSFGLFPLYAQGQGPAGIAAPPAAAPAAPATALAVAPNPEEVERSVIRELRVGLSEDPAQEPTNTDLSVDFEITPEVQDGRISVTLAYLPGVQGRATHPENAIVATRAAAVALLQELDGLQQRTARVIRLLRTRFAN